MIYTMNCSEGLAEQFHYPTLLGANVDALERTFGYSETLCAYDTYQFSDYSRYEVTLFNEKDKAKQHEKQFAECALVFDDMCMADAAASAKELHARSLVFGHGGVLQVGDET